MRVPVRRPVIHIERMVASSCQAETVRTSTSPPGPGSRSRSGHSQTVPVVLTSPSPTARGPS